MLWFGKRKQQEAQFRVLIERYAGFVRATLRQIDYKLSQADLEELEQDVRLKLWQALVGEGNFDKPASYIKKVVNSVAIDAARKRLSRGGDAPHLDYSTLEVDDELSQEVLHYRSELQQLMTRWEEQSQASTQVLSLYLQGFSTEEIGQLLQMSEAKARNMLYRFLAEVRGHAQAK